MHVPPDWPADFVRRLPQPYAPKGVYQLLGLSFQPSPVVPVVLSTMDYADHGRFRSEARRTFWIWHTGCAPDDKWRCRACGHKWNDTDRRGVVAGDPQDFD